VLTKGWLPLFTSVTTSFTGIVLVISMPEKVTCSSRQLPSPEYAFPPVPRVLALWYAVLASKVESGTSGLKATGEKIETMRSQKVDCRWHQQQ
jgi:hypothetical protein